MSKSNSSIPEAPSFQADPNVAWSQDRLKEQYNYLINGLTTQGGTLSGLLGDAVNVSPLVSQYSQQLAQSQLDPAYRKQRQDMINTLEANNQLTGSTTASSLGNLSSDYMASLTGMQAQYGLADVERALNNRVSLYQTGLQTGQAVGAAGLQNQNQMNKFALANYENQVASAMYKNQQQEQADAFWGTMFGPVVGGITGGQTGAMAGLNSPVWNAGMIAGGNYMGGGMGSGGLSGSKYAPQSYTGSLGSESYQDVARMPRMSNSLAGYY